MVTNAEPVEEAQPHERLVEATRLIIAGHPQGSTRRIILYSVLGVSALAGIALHGVVGLVFGGIALVALLLLAMTDQLA